MRSRQKRPWAYLLIAFAFVALDQISKWLVVAYLKGAESVTLIPGFLRLTYLENPGAAFGSLADQRWIFMILSTLTVMGIVWYLLCFAENKHLLHWALALIIGGGIGNMIDRVALGYVIDFIDFYGIWPYIFNVADSCVCIGGGLLVLYCAVLFQKEAKAERQKKAQAEVSDQDGEDT